MATINMSSILSKAEKCMQSNATSKRLNSVVDNAILSGDYKNITFNPEEAAAQFINALQAWIIGSIGSDYGSDYSDGYIGQTACDALLDISVGNLIKIGDKKYTIEVNFDNDLSRQSLYSEKWTKGIENLAALLNNGYEASKTVWGQWHGENIHSLRKREGAHFIDRAVEDFMRHVAPIYGVTSIEVNEIYK